MISFNWGRCRYWIGSDNDFNELGAMSLRYWERSMKWRLLVGSANISFQEYAKSYFQCYLSVHEMVQLIIVCFSDFSDYSLQTSRPPM